MVAKKVLGLLGQLLAEEITDQRGDYRSVFFEGKMAGVEQVELQVLQVTDVCHSVS